MHSEPKISILGVYPSPKYLGIGGVSVHVFRLSENLYRLGMLNQTYNSIFTHPRIVKQFAKKYNQSGIQEIYNSSHSPYLVLMPSFSNGYLSYLYWFLRYAIWDKSNIIHIHNELEYSIYFLLLKKILKKQLVITIHDQMRFAGNFRKNKISYFFAKLLFKEKNIKWIAVNPNIQSQLEAFGVQSHQIKTIPAYIKGVEKGSLPDNLIDFIANHTPLISIYSAGTYVHDGMDLYGIDMALVLINKLKSTYPKIGLVICITGLKDEIAMEKYRDYLSKNDLIDSICFQLEIIENTSILWSQSDIYLRPTNTDGDALAVREALECNCIVAASDIVARPTGCVLFKNRDVNDLFIKVIDILEDKSKYRSAITKSPDYFKQILAVYNSFN